MKKIINHIKRFFLILCMLLCFQLSDIANPEEAHAGFNSLLDRESQVTYSGIVDFVVKLLEDVYICFYKDVIYNLGQLKETCVPRIITSDSSYEQDCANSGDNSAAVAVSFVGLVIFIAALIVVIATFWIPIVGEIIFLAAIVVLALVIMSCLGMYVLAPHEYINGLLGRFDCQKSDGNIINNAKGALTATDVPFFYNCADEQVDKNKIAGDIKNFSSQTWPDQAAQDQARSKAFAGLDDISGYGNMNDPSMPYCQGDSKQYALNILKNSPGIKKDFGGISLSDVNPGAIIVGLVGGNLGIISQITALFSRTVCDISKDNLTLFNTDQIRKGNWSWSFSSTPIPYYRLHSGKIQLCAATISIFFALISGCTYIAPPIEAIPIEAKFTDQTRCSYFLSSRTDLNSLGLSINSQVTDNNYSSVGLFLQSDFHIMSTIIGCVQDLLIKVVVGGTNDANNSFLYQIQKVLTDIVRLVLVLYIALLGIKIISNPNPPQMSEVIMYVLKFGAVVAMSGVAGTNIWYNKSESNPGMYKLLLDSMNGLAGAVLESTNQISPINMCYYDYQGKNLLSEREISAVGGSGAKGLVPTVAMLTKDKIKLSVWDFVDCKLASYLNLNSCKYTMSGMISMWLVSICIFLPSILLLGITTVIFSIVLLITMLRFVHLSIVSMFALTILVLISPIISCFMLFDYTKETFKTWFKMLLGYILYPAMIFSFVALMTTTFDAIFYGQVPTANKGCLATNSCTITDICGTSKSDNSSIYCTIIRAVSANTNETVSANMCNVSSGTILESLTQTYDIKLLGVVILSWQALKDILFEDVFIGIAKMLLFVILFYNMINSIVGFFEALLQVYGIGNLAANYGAFGKKLFGAAAKAPLAVVTAPRAAVNAAERFYKNTRPK